MWKLGAGGKKRNHDNWKRTSAGKIELNSRAVHAFGACCWIRFIYMWSIYLADLKIPAALAWRGGGITQTHAQCASLSRSRSVLCLYLHVVCSMFSLWWLCDGGGVVLSASPGLTSRPSPLAPRLVPCLSPYRASPWRGNFGSCWTTSTSWGWQLGVGRTVEEEGVAEVWARRGGGEENCSGSRYANITEVW